MSNVIDFRTGVARVIPSTSADQEAGRQSAGCTSRRNSLRRPCRAVEHAVKFSGQLERGETIYHMLDVQGGLEKGIQAARHLASELEKVLARYEATPCAEPPTDQQEEALRAMVRRMMAEFGE